MENYHVNDPSVLYRKKSKYNENNCVDDSDNIGLLKSIYNGK